MRQGLKKNQTIIPLQPRLSPPAPDMGLLFEAFPDAALVLDSHSGTVLRANHAAQALFGSSGKALSGKTLASLLGETNPVLDALGGFDQSVTVHEVTLRGRRCGSLSAVPLEEQGLCLIVLRDGAPPVKAEWVDRVKLALKPAQHLARLLGHEIKNPLSGIRGAAQLLAASDLAPDDRDLAVLIETETQRIFRLIDKVNIFDDAPLHQYATVNIHEALAHVMKLCQPGFNGRITAQFDPSLPGIHGHHDRLVQALLNLVKNAIEACEGLGDGGRILIRTWYDAHGAFHPESHAKLPLCIAIEDNGAGISADMQKRLFEPYQTTKHAGSGLGLSIVSKIIDDHGGAVEAASEPGRTVFRISLPRSDAPAGEKA